MCAGLLSVLTRTLNGIKPALIYLCLQRCSRSKVLIYNRALAPLNTAGLKIWSVDRTRCYNPHQFSTVLSLSGLKMSSVV